MAKFLVDVDLNFNQLKSASAEQAFIDPTTGKYRHHSAKGDLISPCIGQVIFNNVDRKLNYCYEKSTEGKYLWMPADSETAVIDITGQPTDSVDTMTLWGVKNRVIALEDRVNQMANSSYATIDYTRGDFVQSYDPVEDMSIIDFQSNDITLDNVDLFVDDEDTLTIKRYHYINGVETMTFKWNGRSIDQSRVRIRVSGRLKHVI